MIELIQTYLIVSLIIYFFPFLLSLLTGNRTGSVFVMNLFLGWTFIGWIWALIWAVTSDGNRNQVTVHNHVAKDKSQYQEREIIVPQTAFIDQLIDKPSLLNQLSQLHALKEKNVITDSIYEQERQSILEKLQGGQAKQTETTIISEPEAISEAALTVNTTEEKELIDEEYNTIFNQKNWLQRNQSWIIGFSIASVAAFCIWYFANGNSQSGNVVTSNSFIDKVGYSFEDYPAVVESVSKSAIDHKSHRLGRLYKTAIKEQYNSGQIDFGGHYITIFWGAGMGLSLGAMVDVNDGKIYELPLNENNSYRGSYHDNNNNILYKASSNLFICYSSQNSVDDEDKVDLTYYFYIWNDTTKEFSLAKTEKLTTKRIDD